MAPHHPASSVPGSSREACAGHQSGPVWLAGTSLPSSADRPTATASAGKLFAGTGEAALRSVQHPPAHSNSNLTHESHSSAGLVPAELMEHFKTDRKSYGEKWMNKAELGSMSVICSANPENTHR